MEKVLKSDLLNIVLLRRESRQAGRHVSILWIHRVQAGRHVSILWIDRVQAGRQVSILWIDKSAGW